MPKYFESPQSFWRHSKQVFYMKNEGKKYKKSYAILNEGQFV